MTTSISPQKLGIFLITYNRAEALRSTLESLATSLFCDYPVTILNNRATDHTLEVCREYEARMPGLKTLTHNANIGGDANYLRGIEYSDSEYTWVLCDDDVLDLSDFTDVLDVIEEGKADLIHVGAHETDWQRWGGRHATPKELLAQDYTFFRFGSFVPCSIVKTKVYTEGFMIKAFRNIHFSYPQMPFQIHMYEADKQVYVAKRQAVTFANLGQLYYHQEEWTFWWMNTSKLLKKKSDVRLCFFDQFVHMTNAEVLENLYYLYQKSEANKKAIREFVYEYFTPQEQSNFRKLTMIYDYKMAAKKAAGEKIYSFTRKIFKSPSGGNT